MNRGYLILSIICAVIIIVILVSKSYELMIGKMILGFISGVGVSFLLKIKKKGI